ncbi:lantibiotic ABC transporter permease [Moraxella atlantae]|uniref:Lantibiotic ABC transporter permease n=1 Tax=Faucicola atlantae TaxID=34059 RepID=A0A1B8Q8P3_9GAMM|nr:lantibiotic ABC transporter permease [Moraxella atlantae]OBX73102.1 lantibiotic ABC transporter permease [Moraxella atlantae]
MLRWIAKNSTIVMPALCVLGMLLPNLSAMVLKTLPAILFFLMFFTLLGLDERKLLRNMALPKTWRFAVMQTAGMTLIATGVAWLCGARGDLLLAIAAISVTAPLFGSGALVNALGFDALEAMAMTIAATLLMPVILLGVLTLLASDGATVDFAMYGRRLAVYVIAPMILAAVARRTLPQHWLQTAYPLVARYNIILLMAFPLGLVGGFRRELDQDLGTGILLFVIAVALVVLYYFGMYLLYRKKGLEEYITASLISGGRNLMLTYSIALPFLGTMFLPLVGAAQLPMFSLSWVARRMIARHQQVHGAKPTVMLDQ